MTPDRLQWAFEAKGPSLQTDRTKSWQSVEHSGHVLCGGGCGAGASHPASTILGSLCCPASPEPSSEPSRLPGVCTV